MTENTDSILFPVYMEKQALNDIDYKNRYQPYDDSGEVSIIPDAEGKTIEHVFYDHEALGIVLSNGLILVAAHQQCCCENVELIDGGQELKELVGAKFIRVDQVTNSDDNPATKDPESYTWTYLNVFTDKGKVQLRWFGESNGYYSEEADWFILTENYNRWKQKTLMDARAIHTQLGESGATLSLYWREVPNDWLLAVRNKESVIPLAASSKRDDLVPMFEKMEQTMVQVLSNYHTMVA